MASIIEINSRVLDPFNKTVFANDTRFSQNFLTKELNQLSGVVDNDSILSYIEITDYWSDESNFYVEIGPGHLIQDKVHFEVSGTTQVVFQLYEHMTIVGVDQTDDFFTVSGNVIEKFLIDVSFAVIDSTGNDDDDWVVLKAEYDDGLDQTNIYVTSPIPDPTIDGEIVYRVVVDSNTTAKLLCFTRFQYLSTSTDNNVILQFCLDYMKDDGTVVHGWSEDKNRTLLGVFSIGKDVLNTQIDSFDKLTPEKERFEINGKTYEIRKDADYAIIADGGQL